jgi:hypothetical protein
MFETDSVPKHVYLQDVKPVLVEASFSIILLSTEENLIRHPQTNPGTYNNQLVSP